MSSKGKATELVIRKRKESLWRYSKGKFKIVWNDLIAIDALFVWQRSLAKRWRFGPKDTKASRCCRNVWKTSTLWIAPSQQQEFQTTDRTSTARSNGQSSLKSDGCLVFSWNNKKWYYNALWSISNESEVQPSWARAKTSADMLRTLNMLNIPRQLKLKIACRMDGCPENTPTFERLS